MHEGKKKIHKAGGMRGLVQAKNSEQQYRRRKWSRFKVILFVDLKGERGLG